MVTAVCQCYKCNYRFNYEYIMGVSYHSIRLGHKRIFRCPNCKTLQKFDLTNKVHDNSLKTYGDSSEAGMGAKIWVMMLLPTFVLTFAGAFSFSIFIQPLYLHFALIAFGIMWVFAYLAYLIMTTGPKPVKINGGSK